jgi:hypothetical protein
VIMGMAVVEAIHRVEQVYLPMVVSQHGVAVREADTPSSMVAWVVEYFLNQTLSEVLAEAVQPMGVVVSAVEAVADTPAAQDQIIIVTAAAAAVPTTQALTSTTWLATITVMAWS